MSHKAAIAAITALAIERCGTFCARDAYTVGVTASQIATLRAAGVVERLHPRIYRLTSVPTSSEQALHAAMLWAGGEAIVASRAAGVRYGLEGVTAPVPEVAVPREKRARTTRFIVHHYQDRAALMVRNVRGLPTTGVEATLVSLAHVLDAEAFEVACEDARRRRLTSVAALDTYLERWRMRGRPGVAATRALLQQLDPVHPARSVLEVKTRRLLVANGFADFVREFPLVWNGRTYLFDFCFPASRTILEVNGRAWHDDPSDYEHDNEKWSVPGRHNYKLVFATWKKVEQMPDLLLRDIATTLAA